MKKLLALSALFILAVPAFAWETIGEGIEYQQWSISGPNNVYVARMIRSNPNASIAMISANDSYKSKQIVRSQMSDNEGRIFHDGTEWGKRYYPIAGVNGDFGFSGGATRSFRISDGQPTIPSFDDGALFGSFFWTVDRRALQGGSYIRSYSVKLTYAGGKQVNITYANDAIPDNGYAMFNPKYGLSVPDCGAAMIVKTDGPVNPGTHSGTVLSVDSGGGRVIPFDCCAVAANGTAAAELLANANAGDTVTIDFSMTTKLTDNSTTITASQIAGTMAGLTGSESVLENGVVKTYTSDLMTSRHPRTAVAFNSAYIFLVVCDGRRSGVSIGMTGVELGNFCKNSLGATHALNLDGGGSSTMITNGTLRNQPSDGSERAIANSLVFYNTLPKEQSTALSPYQQVTTTASSLNVRRGPGTHNPAITGVANGTAGRVTAHELGGILNAGSYWWEVRFPGGVTGWVSEAYLAPGAKDTSAPTVPTGLKEKSVTGSTVTMTWNASTDNYDVEYYKIYRGTTLAGTSETTQFTDTGLLQETTYSYRVSAVDFAGNESAKCGAVNMTTHFDETPPTVPDNLRLMHATSSSVTFAWDPSTDDTAVTGYNVYRGTRLLATLAPGVTTYTESNLTPSTSLTYYVSAFDAQGNTSAKSPALKLRCYKTDYSEGFADTNNWTVVRGGLSSVQNHGDITGGYSVFASSSVTPFMNSLMGLGYRSGRFGAWIYDSGASGAETMVRLQGVNESGEEVLYLGVGLGGNNYRGEAAEDVFNLASRSAGWHHLEIEITPGGRLYYYVDGSMTAQKEVPEAAPLAFKRVFIGDGVSAAGGELYIDDITFDERIPDAPSNIFAASATENSITWGFTHSSDNGVKYMIYDGTKLKAESELWMAKTVTETGLTPNTKYTRKATAAAGNMTSSQSYSGTAYTLALQPGDDTLSYTAPGALPGADIALTALTSYGTGTVAYYRVLVDHIPTHEFDDSEYKWNKANLTLTVTPSTLPYYLHLRSYNTDNVGGDVLNVGPYYCGGDPVTVNEAKNRPDGSLVIIENATVTAIFADCAYVTKDGFGIKVSSVGNYAVGDDVTVAGTMATVNGERIIQ